MRGAQDLAQRLVLAGLAIDRLEQLERDRVVGVGVEDAPVVLLGDVHIAIVRARPVANLERQLALQVGVEDVGDELAVDRRRLRHAAARVGQVGEQLQELAQLGLGDRQSAGARVSVDGAVGIVERAALQLGNLAHARQTLARVVERL